MAHDELASVKAKSIMSLTDTNSSVNDHTPITRRKIQSIILVQLKAS